MGKNFIDQYSLLHFAVGIVGYFWGISFMAFMVIHILFEFMENTEYGMRVINTSMKNVWPGGKPYADSSINTFGDSVWGGLGWLFASMVDNYGNRYGLYEKHIK